MALKASIASVHAFPSGALDARRAARRGLGVTRDGAWLHQRSPSIGIGGVHVQGDLAARALGRDPPRRHAGPWMQHDRAQEGPHRVVRADKGGRLAGDVQIDGGDRAVRHRDARVPATFGVVLGARMALRIAHLQICERIERVAHVRLKGVEGLCARRLEKDLAYAKRRCDAPREVGVG